ncbi:MAG: tetratricopeptide repeat protein [Proteobacteria bacterium]|jgi:hypothetical protein|nr:tetratricopeptide repeat protein [Pseudomonadota bacterium]
MANEHESPAVERTASTGSSRARAALRRALFPAILVALALALYVPTWGHPFLWDDKAMLVDGTAFSSTSSLGELLTAPYRSMLEESGRPGSFYRPASLFALAGELRLFGTSPTGYRICHTALHVACCLLLFALLCRLGAVASPGSSSAAGRRAAFAGAALFTVVPSGVDTILLLTSVGDQMVLAATLAALLLGGALCQGGSRWAFVGLALASVACVFSKESGVWLPVIFAVYCTAIGVRLRSARFAVSLGATIAAAVAMIAARAVFIDPSSTSIREGALWRAIGGLGLAARFSVLPHPLGLEIEVPGVPGPETAIGLAAALSLVVGVLVLRRNRAMLFGISWWAFAATPSLVAVALTGVLGSRYLCVPAAGIACIAAAACLAKRRPAYLAVGGLAAIWILFAVLRAHAWGGDLRLWSREVELNPGRAPSLINLAHALRWRGSEDAAEAMFDRAIEAARSSNDRKNEAYARANLCALYTDQRRNDAAIAQCSAAVKADSGLVFAWLSLGNLHAADGAWDKALRAYQEAARRDPRAYRPMISIAGAAAALGDRELALRYLEMAEAATAGSPEHRADLVKRRALVRERIGSRKE